MTKKFFIFMLATVVTANSYAQAFLGLNFGIGSSDFKFKNFEHLSEEEQNRFKTSIFLQLGVPLELAISEKIAIQSGFFLVEGSGLDSYQIPLNIQYNWDWGFIVPFLQAGTNFNWAKDFADFDGKRYEKGSPSTFDVGFRFGAGLQFKNVQLSYEYGFRNVALPNHKYIKGNYISKAFSFTWFIDLNDRRPSNNRKYDIPEHLRTPYWQIVNVPNTPARDMTDQLKLHQINNGNYIKPKTQNGQTGYELDKYEVWIKSDQFKVGSVLAFKGNYNFMIERKRNIFKEKIKKYESNYDKEVNALKSFTAKLKEETFDHSKISDESFRALLVRGENELKNRQFINAEKTFYQAAIARPNDETALLFYGICLVLNNKNSDADIVLDFSKISDKAFRSLREFGMKEFNIKQFQNAENLLYWAMIARPDDEDAWLYYGISWCLNLKKKYGNERIFNSKISDKAFRTLMDFGMKEFNNKQYQTSEYLFHLAVNARPIDEDAWLYYGITLALVDKYIYEKARIGYDYRKISDVSFRTLMDFGMKEFNNKQYQKSENLLCLAMNARPEEEDAWLYYGISWCLNLDNTYGNEKIFDSDVSDKVFQTLIEYGMKEFKNNKYKTSEYLFLLAINARPNDIETQIYYGINLYENKKYESAIAVLSKYRDNERAWKYIVQSNDWIRARDIKDATDRQTQVISIAMQDQTRAIEDQTREIQIQTRAIQIQTRAIQAQTHSITNKLDDIKWEMRRIEWNTRPSFLP